MSDSLEISGPVNESFAEILTPEALAFTAELARRFEPVQAALRSRPA